MISPTTPLQAELPPLDSMPSATAEVHRTAPTPAVRIALTQNWVRVDLEVEQQYLRDLETLERIERQREEQDPCFFSAMGDVARGRTE